MSHLRLVEDLPDVPNLEIPFDVVILDSEGIRVITYCMVERFSFVVDHDHPYGKVIMERTGGGTIEHTCVKGDSVNSPLHTVEADDT